MLSKWQPSQKKTSLSPTIKQSLSHVANTNLNEISEENLLKSLQEKIDRFEKCFNFFSEIIEELLANQNTQSKNEGSESTNDLKTVLKSRSFSPHKRSFSFLIANKNQPAQIPTKEEEHFFSEKRKTKGFKSFGIKNRYKLINILLYMIIFY